MSLQVKGRYYMIEILLIAALAAAGPIPAFAAEMHQFDVPAEDASSAIRDFAAQAHVQILVAGENVMQQHLHAVSGEYSTDQGLRLLLADSGLSPKYVGDRSIALITVAQESTIPPHEDATKGSSDRLRLAQANQGTYGSPSIASDSSHGASATSEGANQLTEVIVTAQKRTERLQDVPLSLSVIDAETLLQQNALAAKDYLPQVPGVALDQVGSGQDQITIRGIATGFGSNPTVGITIDQVPFGSSVYASLGCCILPELDPLVLDRVEVLRGPQGTLYGANAMGGLIAFVTSTPSKTESAGRAEIDASTVEHGNQGYGVRVAYSTPLVTDRFALQVSAFDRQDPGYISDPLQGRSDVNEAHVSGGRLALDAKLLDLLTMKFSALYQQTTSGGSNMVDIGLSGTPLYGPYEHERMPGTDGLDEHLQFYTLNLTAALGPVSVTSLTGYQRLFFSDPTDYTPVFGPLLPLFYPGETNLGMALFNVIHTDRWTEELRVASSGQTRLQYVAGVFYSSESNGIFQQLAPETYTTGAYLAALPQALIANLQQNYTQHAAFANVTFNVTDRFDIGAGGRYSHNNQNVSQVQSGELIGPTTTTAAVSATEKPITYSFSGRYHFDPDEMLYARIASGFRAGGPNFTYPPGHASFDPDTTVNYELGFKSESWDHRLVVNPALYYIDWTKIQVLQTSSTGLNYFTNGGTAASKGLELSLDVLPASGLHVSGNVAYDDAKLTQDAPPNTFYGLAGDQLPFTAKWTATIASDYVRPISGAVSVFGGFTATYTGVRLIDFTPVATVPRLPMPAFTTVDLRFGSKIERLRATLFVRNVGNTRGFLGGTDYTAGVTNSPTGPWAAALITPRTIGLSLSADF
jgi:iron complex outermembrane receptor protein